MPFICITCNTEYNGNGDCPTCLSQPILCPDCRMPYIQIRFYPNTDRLFIHEVRFNRVPIPVDTSKLSKDPFAHMMIDECCYVKGDRS